MSKNEILIHLGAHRTGTTLFQNYLLQNRENARDKGYDLFGIDRTRDGMLDGLFRRVDDHSMETRRRAEVSAKNLHACFTDARLQGRKVLLSEENILGTMEENLRECAAYPNISVRLARFEEPFSLVSRFYLSIRDTCTWWTSCISFLTMYGLPYPSQATVDRIASSERGWQHVIRDIRRTYPETPITIREFGFKPDNPKQQLIRVSGWKYFKETQRYSEKSNLRSSLSEIRHELLARGERDAAKRIDSGGASFPFSDRQRSQLTERYFNDLEWISNNIRPGDKFLIETKAPLSPHSQAGAGFVLATKDRA